MATYSQKDYVTGLQPTKPDLKFNLQLLQASESAYKTNKRKVSDLYGSILDSEVSRTDNKEAKQEFFKQISQDLRTLGTMDFSLDSNVEQATGMFKSFYSNKYVLNDIVWTEKFNNEYNRGQSLKNCADPEKCGGQWWEEGDKYMAYKKQEFLNASRDEALSISPVEYVPYVDVNSKALKIAKEKFIGVKTDALSSDGRYMITTKNGPQAIQPLTALFNESIGNDPKVRAMYKVQSYNQRMDGIQNILASGEAKTFEEAQVKYFEKSSDALESKLQERALNLQVDLGYLDEKVAEYKKMDEEGKLVKGSKEYYKALEIIDLQKNAQLADQYLELAETARLNINRQSSLDVLNDSFDTRMGIDLMFSAIEKTAESIAMASMETEKNADEYGKMKVKYQYDVALENQKLQNKQNYLEWKKRNGFGTDDDDDDGSSSSSSNSSSVTRDKAANEIQDKKSEVASLRNNYYTSVNEALNKAFGKEGDDLIDIKKPATYANVNQEKFKAVVREERKKILFKKREANKLTIGKTTKDLLVPYPEALDFSRVKHYSKAVQEQYANYLASLAAQNPKKYEKFDALHIEPIMDKTGLSYEQLWDYYRDDKVDFDKLIK